MEKNKKNTTTHTIIYQAIDRKLLKNMFKKKFLDSMTSGDKNFLLQIEIY